jgi:hypothetical protein
MKYTGLLAGPSDCLTMTKYRLFTRTTTVEHISCYCPFIIVPLSYAVRQSAAHSIVAMFSESAEAQLWRELELQSIYRHISNDKTVVNKSNQLIDGPFTISDGKAERLLQQYLCIAAQ